jgi:hypothetical protein
MPREDENNEQQADNRLPDGTLREDEPIPRASDDKVLEETARLAREGQRELASDPNERDSGPRDTDGNR